MSQDDNHPPPAPPAGDHNQPSAPSKDKPKPTASANQNSNSLLNRIQDSATTLIRDAITRPNPMSLGSELQGLQGDKASSSSSASASAATSQLNGYTSTAKQPSFSSSSFRESGLRGPSIRENDEPQLNWLLDASDVSETVSVEDLDRYLTASSAASVSSPRETFMGEDGGKGKGKAVSTETGYEEAWSNATGTRSVSNAQEAARIGHVNEHDGAEVVALLADPSFDAEGSADVYSGYDDDDAVAPLTADEIKILDSFRRQSGIPSNTGTTGGAQNLPVITAHSLIPDIDSFLASDNSSNRTDTSLRDAVLRGLPGAEDWMAVNDRYQDEVWGYLRPALEAAGREIEEKKNVAEEGGKVADGPAVRRLKMILRHMQI
ncbi:hypothetical protein BGW36DRAFT_363174 [Talaromyces proteolyticus]|uniref:Uncharacterized protein n=1 Tax=Talaromyces proteolyticus TaxID=1131652 RepID=A0AAD4KIS3_9EURO|nr:uncharacterized protein BGW36DRAFT_363174 [Talaromyces proteolyticus]KAH8692167.1 hypothetical protein BGW36DRAFT_363174 [Talaromyces proteolyticus]